MNNILIQSEIYILIQNIFLLSYLLYELFLYSIIFRVIYTNNLYKFLDYIYIKFHIHNKYSMINIVKIIILCIKNYILYVQILIIKLHQYFSNNCGNKITIL